MNNNQTGFYTVSQVVEISESRSSRVAIAMSVSPNFILNYTLTKSVSQLSGYLKVCEALKGFSDSLEAKKMVATAIKLYRFDGKKTLSPVFAFSYDERSGNWVRMDRCSDQPDFMIQFIFNRTIEQAGMMRVDANLMVFDKN